MLNDTISVYWADARLQAEADLNDPPIPPRAYRTAHLRLLSQLGKRLLHRALHELPPYSDQPLAGLRYHAAGKPYLADSRYAFSLSHSGQLAACAVSDLGLVGIDIQEQTRLRPGIAGLFLTHTEQQRVSSEDVLALWSQKEAAFKAFGHEYDARLTDFQFEGVRRLRCGDLAVQLLPLATQPGYIGYIACEADTKPVSLTINCV